MDKMKVDEIGLSDSNINFVVILVFGLLLLFGPIEPFGLTVRFAYLILIPVMLLLALRHWGKHLEMDKSANDRLRRALLASIAGSLLVGAYLTYTASSHLECDQYVRNRDGKECVGNYVTADGSDRGQVAILILIAGMFGWYAIAKETRSE